MKRSAKPLYPQMNLLLFNVPATAIPGDHPDELTNALMQLLISVAEAKSEQPGKGGEDESQTNA